MAAQRASSAVGVARAGLTLAAALGLARVFAGGSWVAAVAIAALLPHVLLAVAERRRVPAAAAAAIAVVAGTWFAIVVDDPGTTTAGIPSATTFSTFAHDISRSPQVLRTTVVPAPATGAALLLAIVAVYVVAMLSEWAARRLDAPLGAIGPSIALFVAIAALGSGRWAPTTALYALAVLAYLLAIHYADVTARRTWFHAARVRRSHAIVGGALTSAIVVVVAVVVGPSFPGARGGAWLDYRSLGSGHGGSVLQATPPIVRLRDKLTSDTNDEVFTVESDSGWYWRVIALDELSGDTWGLTSKDPRDATNLRPTERLPHSIRAHQRFDIRELDPYWLPAAYRPVSIDLRHAQVVPESLTLYLVNDAQLADVSYDVDSRVPRPTTTELRSASFRELQQMERDLTLPRDFSPRVRDLAREITRNARTPFDAAAAIESYFTSSGLFRYSLDTKLHSSSSALETFLFDTRAGFCEQFASAFAAMARAVGLPSRVAVGYQPGARASDGLWHVTDHDAHAWPEIWLGTAAGWYAFEPTPGRFNPANGRGNGSGKQTPGPTTAPTTSAQTSETTAPSTAARPQPAEVRVESGKTRTAHDNTGHNVLVGLAITFGLLVAVAVGVLVVAVIAAFRRTRARRRHLDSRTRVVGAWAEALERLAAAGVEPRPSATPIEFALRHAPAHGAGDAGPALMRLARLHTAAMFAPDPPSDDDARLAWEQVDAIEAAVRRSTRRTDRWRSRLRPPGRATRRERELVASIR